MIDITDLEARIEKWNSTRSISEASDILEEIYERITTEVGEEE